MRESDELFAALSRSPFRSRFRLRGRELACLRRDGLERVLDQARSIIAHRLAPAQPFNDGKQTPMRNHPVFVAQHATATCCRGCLEKWHHVPRGVELTAEQQLYVVDVIRRWIESAVPAAMPMRGQPSLFDPD